MKGCLVVLGIVAFVIALLGGGTCFVGGRLIESAQGFNEGISKVESSSDDRFPFTPAIESKLTAERFAQALAVRDTMSKALESEAGDVLALVQGHLEIDEGLDVLRGAFGKGRKELVDIPSLLERELTEARMSFRELAWIVEIAYGHVFAAADRGDARAKAIDEQLNDLARKRALGADASLPILSQFRDHCEAEIVEFDPHALEIVLAAADRFPGKPSATGVGPGPFAFDLFLSQRICRSRER